MSAVYLSAILLFAGPAKPDPWAEFAELQRRQSSYGQQTNLDVRWAEDSKGFFYRLGNDWTFHDVAGGEEREASANEIPSPASSGRPLRQAPRGQSYRTDPSPSGNQILKSDGFNLVLEDKSNSTTLKLSEDGGEKSRLQYGAVSWVYGEEWGQREAMGWSPDGKRFWFYRFDNNPVKPFFLLSGNDRFVNGVDTLDYPKAGDPNPRVEIWAVEYPSMSKSLVASTDDGDAAYLFDIRWSYDSTRLFFQQSDRRHHTRKVVAWNPISGQQKVIWTENNPSGWVHGTWKPGYPTSGPTGIITTEANGYFNLARLNFETGGLERLTQHPFEVERVVATMGDQLFYTAFTGEIAQFRQLFVKFGQGAPIQVTDSSGTHRNWVSPNGEYVVDLAERPSTPRKAVLLSVKPKQVKVIRPLAKEAFAEAAKGVTTVEARTFKSADGTYDLLGIISRPQKDPLNSPVIFEVYNGPESVGASAGFQTAHPWTALGFTVISVESRGGDNRGRDFRNADYLKLGLTEIDDIAAATKAFCGPNQKVGIQGTSYGGYVAALAILRYPDLFHASVACSSVTDYRHYDTIYTERFMGLPSENKEGYDAGSCATYAKNLKGSLLLFAGLRDDNVHPNNTFHLVEALRRAGKYFNVMIGPNAGHTYVGTETALKFFGDSLGNPVPPREGTL